MLRSFFVKDYALIKESKVEFDKGLNIITGETGAGKSILVDAMNLILGDRASSEVIREGSEKAVVEGIFDVESNKKIKNILTENKIEFYPELIVRREISLKGTNRNFINDTPVQLSLIKEVGDLLVDLHGQHEHQSLLRNETHIDYLDQFAGTEDYLRNYKWLHKSLSKLKEELKTLKENNSQLIQSREVLLFQLKEINGVSPYEGEEDEIDSSLTIMENSERLLELTNEIYGGLFESEAAIYDSLVKIKNALSELSQIEKKFDPLVHEFESAVAMIKDVSEEVRNYNSKIEMDPNELEKLRERLHALNMLKKKYGGSVKAVLEHKQRIENELKEMDNSGINISELEEKLKKVEESTAKAAIKLSQLRKNSVKKVEKEVRAILDFLGISNSEFNVKIENNISEDEEDYLLIDNKKYEYNSSGYDNVEFYISTNLGESPKPLAKIASGGEISRVMLALKTILAKSDKLPILIFDEIDTGISGQIAAKVGQAMKSLAENHQIIAITHLPQIAGLADHHFVVQKEIIGERVVSSMRELDHEKRIFEVAKLLSGENITEASLKGAKELIEQQNI
jgi:DNA repair protein RecN (Recombination protein N)